MKRITLISLAVGMFAVASMTGARAALVPAEDGKALFSANCAQCHNTTSTETKVGPGLKGLFKAKTLPGTGRPTTVANVTSQIKNGGGGMPAFSDSLNDAQISAIVAYLKTL